MAVAHFDGEDILPDHTRTFLERMNELRLKNDKSCDVSFNVNGKEFPCHELVLTTTSTYFKTMFSGNFKENESRRNIPLEDIEPNTLEQILNAIYTGTFRITRENAYFLIRGSHMLQLMDILDVVVSRMKTKNFENIHHLVAICIFAKKIDHEELHSLCIKGIASDFDTLTKTDSFNELIPYDILKTILQHKDFNGDMDTIFYTILRWNKHHKCSEDEILFLLDSLDSLDNYILSIPLMAKLIVNNTIAYENHLANGQNKETEKSASSDEAVKTNGNSSSDFSLYVYLNVVDVKTGAKGWIILRTKNEFNDYEIVNYEASDFPHRRVRRLRNKLYCFEYDGKGASEFSYFADGQKKSLTSLPADIVKEYCDMTVCDDGNKLFIIAQDEELWMHDCKKNTWVKLDLESDSEKNTGKKRKYEDPSPDYPKITSDGNTLYVRKKPTPNCKSGILALVVNDTDSGQGYSPSKVDLDLPNNKEIRQKNPAFCYFDGKLIVCGSSRIPRRGVVSVYDFCNNNRQFLEKMKMGRSNHMLVHINGFLYAIENKPVALNEKYDVKLNKWTFIPSLPQRIYYAPKNVTLATGDVFSCDVE